MSRTIDDWRRARRKSRAIDGYLRRLPRTLLRDYGAALAYTPAQVRGSVARSGLDVPNDCYALAMFCDRGSFDADHAASGEACDYAAMRADVAALHLGGDASFTAETLLDADRAGAGGYGCNGAGHHHASDGGHGQSHAGQGWSDGGSR